MEVFIVIDKDLFNKFAKKITIKKYFINSGSQKKQFYLHSQGIAVEYDINFNNADEMISISINRTRHWSSFSASIIFFPIYNPKRQKFFVIAKRSCVMAVSFIIFFYYNFFDQWSRIEKRYIKRLTVNSRSPSSIPIDYQYSIIWHWPLEQICFPCVLLFLALAGDPYHRKLPTFIAHAYHRNHHRPTSA